MSGGMTGLWRALAAHTLLVATLGSLSVSVHSATLDFGELGFGPTGSIPTAKEVTFSLGNTESYPGGAGYSYQFDSPIYYPVNNGLTIFLTSEPVKMSALYYVEYPGLQNKNIMSADGRLVWYAIDSKFSFEPNQSIRLYGIIPTIESAVKPNPGPFSEKLGTFNIRRDPSTLVYNEDVYVTGTFTLNTCQVTPTQNVSFGHIKAAGAGDVLSTKSFDIGLTCNPIYESAAATSITFQSSVTDGNLFAAPDFAGAGIRISDEHGTTIEPGRPYRFPTRGKAPSFNASVIQRGSTATGQFSISVDMTLSYN
ncbi:fimbrial protein [Pantoea sp. SORGH_AS_0659]|uniref:fimbrial protein n=1 Tax=Pantoea sp. SORGH_AS_0659 TaxID=3062597 RepID=UPI00285F9EF2|nr:fimbrial protein [Pantoea sp. SORGH_AS_0659]MDR6352457.1 type 1 fimbria pilin [Pantoea sp. SORGH_AS_0659]